MNNKELVMNVRKAVDGNLEATFKLILEFESVINQECKIDGKFNQDSKDYIVDKLILKIKKFKKYNFFYQGSSFSSPVSVKRISKTPLHIDN